MSLVRLILGSIGVLHYLSWFASEKDRIRKVPLEGWNTRTSLDSNALSLLFPCVVDPPAGVEHVEAAATELVLAESSVSWKRRIADR